MQTPREIAFAAALAGALSLSFSAAWGASRDLSADEVALAAKRKAASALSNLLAEKKGTHDEPAIRLRHAELTYSASGIAFRVANARVSGSSKPADLGTYKTLLKSVIEDSNRILKSFPDALEDERALYLRAKAYDDSGSKDAAISDLRVFIEKYPQSQDLPLALLMLGELLTAKKDYAEADRCFNRLLKNPSVNFQLTALDRLAWVHYYLNEIPTALQYIRREVELQGSKNAQAKSVEQPLSSATLFFGTALEKKVPGIAVQDAFNFIRELTPAPVLGKLLVQLVYVMRTKGLDASITELQHVLDVAHPDPSDALEVSIAIFEHRVNQRESVLIRDSLRQFDALIEGKDAEAISQKARSHLEVSLNEAAKSLHDSFSELKDKSRAVDGGNALIDCYALMLRAKLSDPNVASKLRFNMAEVQFALKQYESATSNYRWVAIHDRSLTAIAYLKSIAARYEVYQANGSIPKALEIRTLESPSGREFPTGMVNWIRWVDDYAAHFQNKNPSGTPVHLDSFQFEAARMIYYYGKTSEAVTRLRDFLKAYPDSSFAIDAASLVLDTYVKSAKWKEAQDFGRWCLESPSFKDPDFRNRVTTVTGDAGFKISEELYNAKKFPEAIAEAERFWTAYPANSHRSEGITLAANARLALNDRKKAQELFGLLKDRAALDTSTRATIDLTDASIEEDDFELAKSAGDYVQYISEVSGLREAAQGNPSDEDLVKIRRKALFFYWLSRENEKLDALLRKRSYCEGDLGADCSRLRVLSELASEPEKLSPRDSMVALKRSSEDDPEIALLGTASALKGFQHLSPKDQYRLLERAASFSSAWEKLSPLVSFTVLPTYMTRLPEAFRTARIKAERAAPVKIDKRSISRRIDRIDELEKLFTSFASFPWLGVRVAALNEIAELYADLSKDLLQIRPPKGLTKEETESYRQSVAELVAPFNHKRDELRLQAITMGSSASVDGNTLAPVADAYVSENPALAATLIRDPADLKNPKLTRELILSALAGLSKRENLKEVSKQIQTFVSAAQKSNFPLVAYFVRQFKERSLLPEAEIHRVSGVLLALLEARAEAVREFEEASKDSVAEAALDPILALAYYESLSFPKAKDVLGRVDRHRSEYASILTAQDLANLDQEKQWVAALEAELKRHPAGAQPK